MTPTATTTTAVMTTTTERGGSVAHTATRPPDAGGRGDLRSHTDRRPPRRPSAGWVSGGTLGAFLAVFGALAVAGDEPAAEPVAAKPGEIVVRRVITRVVVHHAAPIRRSPSPAAVRPAPAAPAPAPAPLTTQSS